MPFHLGLCRTSRAVRKSGEFSKSGLSGNWTCSFLEISNWKIPKIKCRKIGGKAIIALVPRSIQVLRNINIMTHCTVPNVSYRIM